jgi:hypothetical protein
VALNALLCAGLREAAGLFEFEDGSLGVDGGAERACCARDPRPRRKAARGEHVEIDLAAGFAVSAERL